MLHRNPFGISLKNVYVSKKDRDAPKIPGTPLEDALGMGKVHTAPKESFGQGIPLGRDSLGGCLWHWIGKAKYAILPVKYGRSFAQLYENSSILKSSNGVVIRVAIIIWFYYYLSGYRSRFTMKDL